jgi:hypothetical protein
MVVAGGGGGGWRRVMVDKRWQLVSVVGGVDLATGGGRGAALVVGRVAAENKGAAALVLL